MSDGWSIDSTPADLRFVDAFHAQHLSGFLQLFQSAQNKRRLDIFVQPSKPIRYDVCHAVSVLSKHAGYLVIGDGSHALVLARTRSQRFDRSGHIGSYVGISEGFNSGLRFLRWDTLNLAFSITATMLLFRWRIPLSLIAAITRIRVGNRRST